MWITGGRESWWRIGLVEAHEVCAELRDTAAYSVRVIWYVNRPA